MSNLKLKLTGLENKEHEIDYFNIVSYERDGDHALLVVKKEESSETETLPIAMPADALRMRINDVEKYINTLKDITLSNLSNIEDRYYNFFRDRKSKITDYIDITWSQPVEIRFNKAKTLAPEIADEIKEKFWTIED